MSPPAFQNAPPPLCWNLRKALERHLNAADYRFTGVFTLERHLQSLWIQTDFRPLVNFLSRALFSVVFQIPLYITFYSYLSTEGTVIKSPTVPIRAHNWMALYWLETEEEDDQIMFQNLRIGQHRKFL